MRKKRKSRVDYNVLAKKINESGLGRILYKNANLARAKNKARITRTFNRIYGRAPKYDRATGVLLRKPIYGMLAVPDAKVFRPRTRKQLESVARDFHIKLEKWQTAIALPEHLKPVFKRGKKTRYIAHQKYAEIEFIPLHTSPLNADAFKREVMRAVRTVRSKNADFTLSFGGFAGSQSFDKSTAEMAIDSFLRRLSAYVSQAKSEEQARDIVERIQGLYITRLKNQKDKDAFNERLKQARADRRKQTRQLAKTRKEATKKRRRN